MSADATSVTAAGARRNRWRIAGWALLLLVAVALPFIASPYRNTQFTQVIVYAVAILGLNLLVGYGGQISLGHGAFFALGAYTTAILIKKAGFPHLLAIIPAGLVTFIAGLLFGIPALRLRGLYLALVTLALAVATPPLIKRFEGLTGGSQGLNVAQPQSPTSGLASDQFLYLLCLAIAAVTFVLVANLLRGRVGRALISVRDSEIVAKSMGINLATYKTAAFAVSASLAGVAGALYVYAIGFVSPESFPLTLSIQFLAAVVVGGLATVGGAVLGALFIVFVPVYASDVSDALAGVIYGIVLILFMIFLPHGAMGLIRKITGKLRRGRGGEEALRQEPRPSPTTAGTGTTKGVPAAGR